MDERECSDLYRVRKTLCQMLDDRGYVISEDDLTMNLTEFKEMFVGDNGKVSRERCQITTCKESDASDQVSGCKTAPRPLSPSYRARWLCPHIARRSRSCSRSSRQLMKS